MPYNTPTEAFDIHCNDVIDSCTVDLIVDDLVKGYFKIPKKIRNSFKKSCYNIEIITQISQTITSDLVFAQAKINFSFSFQSDKPYKRSRFKRMFRIF